MKSKTITLLMLVALLGSACSDTSGPAHDAVVTDVQTYKSIGVIKSIDLANSKVTVDHEDIPGFM